jgi:hypothetical protein
MAKQRSPVQVSPEFHKRLEELQRKIMGAKQEKVSFRELTEDIIKSPFFIEIEKSLIRQGNINMDFNINFDSRRRR